MSAPWLAHPAAPAVFQPQWRERRFAAFDLATTSTAGHALFADVAGQRLQVYANANLSVYSGQSCNARCAFCVEELRPASRGTSLEHQKRSEADDVRYFSRLDSVLAELAPLDLTASVTGGEASLDQRLPGILRLLADHRMRRRTLTTNGSGLLHQVEGRRVVDWIGATGVQHLNLSRAHPDGRLNQRLMAMPDGLADHDLRLALEVAQEAGTRPRLSCVLLKAGVASPADALAYLTFARHMGVDNVIFRQLMQHDPLNHDPSAPVVRYAQAQRVPLQPLLEFFSTDSRFSLVRQVVGYYYYVEVWRFDDGAGPPIDVVAEEADLGHLELTKRTQPGLVHELVFHPDGTLASTWQPWDGVISRLEA